MWPVLLAALAAVALAAAANAWNDVADVDIDRVAHRERPLPSGALTIVAARCIAWIAAAIGMVCAAFVSGSLALLTLAVLTLMYGYSPWIKRLGLPGNLVVAVLASLPFLYGAWAAGNARAGLLLVGIAAPLHFAREIAKDLDDEAADRGTRRTLPVAHGHGAARGVLVASLLVFGIALVPLALSQQRFALAMIPALLVGALATALVLRGRRGAPALLKAAMLLSMLALVISQA